MFVRDEQLNQWFRAMDQMRTLEAALHSSSNLGRPQNPNLTWI
jgi:hypothetical protein